MTDCESVFYQLETSYSDIVLFIRYNRIFSDKKGDDKHVIVRFRILRNVTSFLLHKKLQYFTLMQAEVCRLRRNCSLYFCFCQEEVNEYKKENIKGARNLIFRRDFFLTIYAKYATTNMQNISSSLTLAS